MQAQSFLLSSLEPRKRRLVLIVFVGCWILLTAVLAVSRSKSHFQQSHAYQELVAHLTGNLSLQQLAGEPINVNLGSGFVPYKGNRERLVVKVRILGAKSTGAGVVSMHMTNGTWVVDEANYTPEGSDTTYTITKAGTVLKSPSL